MSSYSLKLCSQVSPLLQVFQPVFTPITENGHSSSEDIVLVHDKKCFKQGKKPGVHF